MNITDEAVQVAAKALWERVEHSPWKSAKESHKEPYLIEAHTAIEAAIPHLRS